MSGGLRYVCVIATPIRVPGGIPTFIKRGALVDGDSDVVLENPENFRPASERDTLVRRNSITGEPFANPSRDAIKPLRVGMKENER